MTELRRDRVQREMFMKAPREKVFAALTDDRFYPSWGPEKIIGKLAVGERPILDFGPSGGGKVCVYVVAVEPPVRFAFRWMQGVTDPQVLLGDPLKSHNTLVEFTLEGVEGGTLVRVVESGLASLPAVAGMDTEEALENIGKGWELMLGGLGRAFTATEPQDKLEYEHSIKATRERVYDALVHPDRWWAEMMDGRFAPGETPLLDFGPFGQWRIHVEKADAPTTIAYRRVQGVEDPGQLRLDPREHPNTLVSIQLHSAPEGTHVHVTESGFLALKTQNLATHFRRAQAAWPIIMGLLQQHFEKGT
ncbi:MAG: SRPBCC domain-containing protein [Myxococcota bacterium]